MTKPDRSDQADSFKIKKRTEDDYALVLYLETWTC